MTTLRSRRLHWLASAYVRCFNRLSRFQTFLGLYTCKSPLTRGCLLVLTSMALSFPSAKALTPQTLAPISTPTVSRGGSGTIEFTASRVASSIIQSFTIIAPEGMVFISQSGSNLPTCNVITSFPSSTFTCSGSTVAGNGYFPFGPTQQVTLQYTVDPAANLGELSGAWQMTNRYAGTSNGIFSVIVTPTDQLQDGVTSTLVRIRRDDLSNTLQPSTTTAPTTVYDESTMAAAFNPGSSNIVQYDGVAGTTGSNMSEFSPVGKILVVYASGQTGNCSGTVVPSAGKNIILTAAHCLFDPTGNRATDLYFCPGWSPDTAVSTTIPGNPLNTLGCPSTQLYRAQTMRVGLLGPYIPQGFFNTSYTDDQQLYYDVAFVSLEPNAVTRQNIEYTTGSYGMVFNKFGSGDQSATVVSVGYFGNLQPLSVCRSSAVKYSYLWSFLNTILLNNAQQFTLHWLYQSGCSSGSSGWLYSGSSGGPLIIGHDNQTNTYSGYVFGVNSYLGPSSYGPVTYYPIFRDWVKELYTNVSGIPLVKISLPE